ncbi:MAG: hypothetical protein HY957_09470 [Nitrospirae bacterium]|nr:hypothetical protein [Nitrospirota bacterium]
MEDGVKMYGLCLERMRHQINIAKKKSQNTAFGEDDIFLLESYNTGDIEDIIDILELYDIENKTIDALHNKLEELAYTASVLIRETLRFGFTYEGHLGLYLTLNKETEQFQDAKPCYASYSAGLLQ